MAAMPERAAGLPSKEQIASNLQIGPKLSISSFLLKPSVSS
jgi:hypothetical protein